MTLNQIAGSAFNNALPLEAASSLVEQLNTSSQFGSFGDALASAQAASADQSQTETVSNTVLTQTFQNGATWQSATFGNQFGGSSSSSFEPPKSSSSSSSSSAPAATAKPTANASPVPKEDSYVASSSQNETDQNVSQKPADKSKHRKQASQDDAPAASSQTTPASSDEPVAASVTATATNLEQSGAQTAQPTPTPATPSRKTKTDDSIGSLAFAVKVQGTNTTADPSSASANPSPATPVLSGATPVSDFAAQLSGMMAPAAQKNTVVNSGKSDVSTALGLNTVSAATSDTPSSTESIANEAPTEVAKAVEVPAEQPATPQAAKSVQVQITGTDNQRVDVRLMEKSGSLTMSVRSTDGTLTKALQQQLPELAKSLNDLQVRTEWWKPDTQTASSQTTAGNSSKSGSDGESGQNRENSGQQQGRSPKQTDWLEELANLQKTSQNGAQYTWHL